MSSHFCDSICDFCQHYAFNGVRGAYVGKGRCEHPNHPRASEPFDDCADFTCICSAREQPEQRAVRADR